MDEKGNIMSDDLKKLLWSILGYMEHRQDAHRDGEKLIPNQEMEYALRLREHLGVRDKP